MYRNCNMRRKLLSEAWLLEMNLDLLASRGHCLHELLTLSS